MFKAGIFISVFLIAVIFSTAVVCAQEELYEKGFEAYLRKDYAAAVRYLKEYVGHMPDAKAYYLLGYASYELERKARRPNGRRESAKYFREAYLIDPNISIDAFKKVGR